MNAIYEAWSGRTSTVRETPLPKPRPSSDDEATPSQPRNHRRWPDGGQFEADLGAMERAIEREHQPRSPQASPGRRSTLHKPKPRTPRQPRPSRGCSGTGTSRNPIQIRRARPPAPAVPDVEPLAPRHEPDDLAARLDALQACADEAAHRNRRRQRRPGSPRTVHGPPRTPSPRPSRTSRRTPGRSHGRDRDRAIGQAAYRANRLTRSLQVFRASAAPASGRPRPACPGSPLGAEAPIWLVCAACSGSALSCRASSLAGDPAGTSRCEYGSEGCGGQAREARRWWLTPTSFGRFTSLAKLVTRPRAEGC